MKISTWVPCRGLVRSGECLQLYRACHCLSGDVRFGCALLFLGRKRDKTRNRKRCFICGCAKCPGKRLCSASREELEAYSSVVINMTAAPSRRLPPNSQWCFREHCRRRKCWDATDEEAVALVDRAKRLRLLHPQLRFQAPTFEIDLPENWQPGVELQITTDHGDVTFVVTNPTKKTGDAVLVWEV